MIDLHDYRMAEAGCPKSMNMELFYSGIKCYVLDDWAQFGHYQMNDMDDLVLTGRRPAGYKANERFERFMAEVTTRAI